MQIYRLCTGEDVHRYQKSIVVRFRGRRRVLSTGPHNGGLRDDLTAVFNNDCKLPTGLVRALKAPTYAGHMALMSEELGLDAATATGLSTAAQMENVGIRTETYKDITVTAIVTGGIEVNGGRAGDPASWDELEDAPLDPDSQPEMDPEMDPHAHARKKDREETRAKEEAAAAQEQSGEDEMSVHAPDPDKMRSGTINIMLFINVDLTPGALVRSLVTCTEAKTAALQELMAVSRYSNGLATGSGTDGTIIVANAESKIRLDDAGKHGKLGELIGRTVKEALKEALLRQSGLSPEMQRTVLRRVDRFGITPETLWEALPASGQSDRGLFWDRLERMCIEEDLVAAVSLYVHLMDQLNWGLFSVETVFRQADGLIAQIGDGCAGSGSWPGQTDTETALSALTGRLQEALAARLLRDMER